MLDSTLSIPSESRGPPGLSAHSAGIRAQVPVQSPFVVLTQGQSEDASPIGQRVNRDLLARKVLLDDHHVAAGAKDALRHHAVHRRNGFVLVLGDDDPFTRRQTRGLDHDREGQLRFEVELGIGSVTKSPMTGRGYAMARHEFLGKGLGALEFRGSSIGAEDQEPGGSEDISQTPAKRSLGSDDDQFDAMGLGGLEDSGVVVRADLKIGCEFRGESVPGRTEQSDGIGATLQRPKKGVFATARADDQDSHARLQPQRSREGRQ